MQKLVVLGAGGFARQAVWCIERHSDLRVVALFDELQTEPRDYKGIPIVADLAKLANENSSLALVGAVGDANLRRRWALEYGSLYPFWTVIDPDALVAPNARLGEGSIVLPGAICSTNAQVGDHVLIGFNASVSHDVSVGSFTHLAGGVILNGHSRVGEGCQIGAGAIVLPHVRIGDGAVVGAGAVVNRDVEPGRTVAGVPARSVVSRRT